MNNVFGVSYRTVSQFVEWHRLCLDLGLPDEGFGCMSIWSTDAASDWIVVETLSDWAGRYSIEAVGSYDCLDDALEDVSFRSDYNFRYGVGYSVCYEIWHVLQDVSL